MTRSQMFVVQAFPLIAVLLIFAIASLAFLMVDANRFLARANTFTKAYQDVREQEYIRTVCGIDGGTSPKTDKDNACVNGVKQRVKDEIEAMKK